MAKRRQSVDPSDTGDQLADPRLPLPDTDAERATPPPAPSRAKRAAKGKEPAKDTPHYHGHRDRLRDRFLNAGVEALRDYELLELLLFRAIPRRDVKPLAKTLIARFGSLADVLGADPERLMEVEGVGRSVMAELKIVHGATIALLQGQLLEREVITSWSALQEYLRVRLATEKIEQFRVLFLDHKNQLLADEMQQQGTVNQTPAYPREIMRRALELHASAVILVHNHPSGDPKPSQDDITMTAAIVAAAQPLKIRVHDHLIVGRKTVLSFRAQGLL